MPKRLTVTEKWNDEWFISLSPQAKVIWEYIRDNCDISGVWDVNIELLRFRVKFSPQVDVIKHLEELNEAAQKLGIEDRVEWFTDRKKIWIKNFIRIQYGILSEKSSTHRGVMKVIENHSHTKGLPKGYLTLIGALKVKNKIKVKNIINTRVFKEPNIPFELFWTIYDKKIEKQKCEKLWKKLSDEDRTAIMAYIPKYKEAQPEKQYRKHPETFLTHRAWEDEIIPAAPKAPNGAHEPQPTNAHLLKKITA
jgi:hypothetical protein